MSELQIANVLQAVLVVVVGSYICFKLLPDYRVDSFRQKMFAVRDEMFDFAADGNIPFDDPAYVLLRKQMNGMIRYGHQLTLFRSLSGGIIRIVLGESETLTWHQSWEESLANIEQDSVRARMSRFHERGTMIAVRHLISGSPTLWITLFVVAVCMMATGAASGIRQLLKAASERVFTGPLDQRLIEENAVGALA